MTAVVCEALMWPPKLVLPVAALYALSHCGPIKNRGDREGQLNGNEVRAHNLRCHGFCMIGEVQRGKRLWPPNLWQAMRRLLFCVLAMVCIAGSRADAAELYDRTGQPMICEFNTVRYSQPETCQSSAKQPPRCAPPHGGCS